jgi:hypothetical protein
MRVPSLDDETVVDKWTNSTSVTFGVGHVQDMWTNSERDVRYPLERPIALENGVRLGGHITPSQDVHNVGLRRRHTGFSTIPHGEGNTRTLAD